MKRHKERGSPATVDHTELGMTHLTSDLNFQMAL